MSDDFEVSEVNERGVTTIPKRIRETLGRHIKWIPQQDGAVRVEKVTAIVVFAFAALFMFNTPAFAQTDPNTIVFNDPPVQPTIGPTFAPIITPTHDTLPLASDAARLPFRIEFTYPSGTGDIWNVTRLSPVSVYGVQEVVGQGGVTTKIFTTGTIDTFTVTVGQRYPFPVDQVGRIVVYSNNTAVIPGWTFPIQGQSFERTITFTTSPAPHIPTPEENARPFLEASQRLESKIDVLDARTERQDITFSLTGNLLQGALGLVIILCIVLGAAAFAILFMYKKLKSYESQRVEEIRSESR